MERVRAAGAPGAAAVIIGRHLAAVDAVHLGEELVDDALGRLVAVPAPPRRQGVELVEEEDAGGGGPGAREELPDRALRLSHVLVQQLGALWPPDDEPNSRRSGCK